MSQRDKAESAISELLEATYRVYCGRCGAKDTVDATDDYGAATAFYDSGWRAKGEQLLCRKCRRKQ